MIIHNDISYGLNTFLPDIPATDSERPNCTLTETLRKVGSDKYRSLKSEANNNIATFAALKGFARDELYL